MTSQVQPGCCECLWCWGRMPEEIEIEFVGLASDATCGDCESLNAVYICQLATEYVQDVYVSDRLVPGGVSCRWEYRLPTPICDYQLLVVSYSRNYPDPWRLTVELSDDAPVSPDAFLFRTSFSEKHSCADLDGLTVPFYSMAGSGSGACNPIGSYAVATAL